VLFYRQTKQCESNPVSDAPVKLYVSHVHACGYYPERVARNLVIDPDAAQQDRLYHSAIEQGFRRAGAHIYRPYCAHCQACVASRINIAKFRANRAQKRCLTRNADVTVHRCAATQNPENFALYQRYLATRHADGGMDAPESADFDRFLCSPWSNTEFIELRIGDQLVAVTVTDLTRSGLSAVYCFYEPALQRRSLGVFAVLTQIQRAKAAGLAYLYLGFWLDGHPKMHYKAGFSGLEVRHDGQWCAYGA
jgi:leucyl-tRNA---protein transferase